MNYKGITISVSNNGLNKIIGKMGNFKKLDRNYNINSLPKELLVVFRNSNEDSAYGDVAVYASQHQWSRSKSIIIEPDVMKGGSSREIYDEIAYSYIRILQDHIYVIFEDEKREDYDNEWLHKQAETIKREIGEILKSYIKYCIMLLEDVGFIKVKCFDFLI